MPYTALIVDDDEHTRLIYERILKHAGFDVTLAADGAQALEMLQNGSADVLFLDILLPKVNGTVVLSYVQNAAHLNSMYVVIVSAHNRFERSIEIQRANEFFVKPVRPLEIEEVARRAIAHLAAQS
jgi:DNA-binding NtrC family response regulator